MSFVLNFYFPSFSVGFLLSFCCFDVFSLFSGNLYSRLSVQVFPCFFHFPPFLNRSSISFIPLLLAFESPLWLLHSSWIRASPALKTISGPASHILPHLMAAASNEKTRSQAKNPRERSDSDAHKMPISHSFAKSNFASDAPESSSSSSSAAMPSHCAGRFLRNSRSLSYSCPNTPFCVRTAARLHVFFVWTTRWVAEQRNNRGSKWADEEFGRRRRRRRRRSFKVLVSAF